MTNTFTFIGCSFTAGVGLELEKNDPNLYANIVAAKFSTGMKNIAIGGNSNHNIFIQALNEILFDYADKIFIQWSGLNRLWLYPAPDTKLFLSYTVESDYKYRDLVYPKKRLQEFSQFYHMLCHDYNHLMALINYCNILSKIGSNKIIFINGLLPWTMEITDADISKDFSKYLSHYSKSLLEFETTPDEELHRLFKKLNGAVSSLNPSQWVNMFESMQDKQIDTGNDNGHPGPKSHQLYADMIIKYLEDNNDKRI